MIVRVVLEGGVPWGFRVHYDGRRHAPRISKLRARGRAERAGLKPDDVILSVNGTSTAGLRDVDVIGLIQQSQRTLCLDVERSVAQIVARADGRHQPAAEHEPTSSFNGCSESSSDELLDHVEACPAVQLPQHVISRGDYDTSNGVHSDEDENDVSKSSASVTSDIHDTQELDDCVHRQRLDPRQSNANTASTPPMSPAEPDEFCCSTDASYILSEGQTGSSLRTSNGPGTTLSDVQKENGATYTDAVRNEPSLKHQMNNASDSLPLDNDVFATEKYPVKFKGIGPTDEETGIPIASRTMVEESYQKEWYRRMFLALHKLTGLKCPPMYVFAGEDPDPRLAAVSRLSSSSDANESPINAALRRNVSRRNSAESMAHHQRQSFRRSSSMGSSPRISPHPALSHSQSRLEHTSDLMYRNASSREQSKKQVAASPFTSCDNFTSFADAEQVLMLASSISSGNEDDPLPQYPRRMLNGDGGFGNKFETSGNDSNSDVMNGRTDHDTNVSNKASHFQLIGSTPDNQNNSIRRLCALFDYSPRHADELELLKGDIVCLVDVCDDGWCIGTSERTKLFGTFPGNYVRPVT